MEPEKQASGYAKDEFKAFRGYDRSWSLVRVEKDSVTIRLRAGAFRFRHLKSTRAEAGRPVNASDGISIPEFPEKAEFGEWIRSLEGAFRRFEGKFFKPVFERRRQPRAGMDEERLQIAGQTPGFGEEQSKRPG